MLQLFNTIHVTEPFESELHKVCNGGSCGDFNWLSFLEGFPSQLNFGSEQINPVKYISTIKIETRMIYQWLVGMRSTIIWQCWIGILRIGNEAYSELARETL